MSISLMTKCQLAWWQNVSHLNDKMLVSLMTKCWSAWWQNVKSAWWQNVSHLDDIKLKINILENSWIFLKIPKYSWKFLIILDLTKSQCSWACLGQKKCYQRSVNGFFHQFIYSVWKVKTQNLTLGALGDSQNGSFYLVNALEGHFPDYSSHFVF